MKSRAITTITLASIVITFLLFVQPAISEQRVPLNGCMDTPFPVCHQAERADFIYTESKQKLRLRWRQPSSLILQGEFGDPATSLTSASACIYDDNDQLVTELLIDRGAQICGSRPCWKTLGTTGYRYRDPNGLDSGVQSILFKAGAINKGKVALKGYGRSLPGGISALLLGDIEPTIQLTTSEGFCISAKMNRLIRANSTEYRAVRR